MPGRGSWRQSMWMPAGKEMSGVEFERVGGKDGAKKWRQSVRTMQPNGDAGQTMAQWLAVRHELALVLA